MSEWHRWFAWYPVRLGSWRDEVRPWAWLRYVERCEECGGCAFYSDCWWVYR